MIKCLNEQQMLAFGAEFSKRLEKGDTIYLHGDLGAGKTTLVKGMLKGLGYQGMVKSPTYSLVEAYEFKAFTLYHFDLYRLADPEELEWLGIRDYFTDHSVCLIEWPEKGKGILPEATYTVDINYLSEGREINISAI